ncbi:hypothetical protein [Sulfitobacter guttiformis]|uniref:Uncharacterized protein n=1 Tax=Sulfitobacter guttiformis TaxID=74349 RepID=A0A420DR09_9RHOB|nr:hypothetical protein [Sulfitobacter guttiformis]RKE96672.1 hypothetical protein C8N30_1239 [Sulfitobacter guttiformis]
MSEETSERAVVLIHHRAAQRYAHRLFAFSSSVFAEGWIQQARDDFNEDLFNFCFHAYRLCDLLGIKDGQLDISQGGTLHFKHEPSLVWETDFRRCLNTVRHCNTIQTGNARAPDGRKLFNQDENLMAAFVEVATDKHPQKRCIPIFALSYSYLQHVRPMVANFLNQQKKTEPVGSP